MTARTGTHLVLGGARSGKSAFAERCVAETGLAPLYIATAQALDDEMTERIATHRARRGPAWTTIEAPADLAGTLSAEAGERRILLVDCLTLWLTNRMIAEADMDAEIDALVAAVAALNGPAILVANEVGLGIVPDNAMARRFRDHAGRLNQAIAARADTVTFIAAGLPLTLKG
ncbi:bifunctional adenosylcobinamide kinase/adenosylcobinamide-phosphate guanylyltransferase [Pararhizobium mangrovi]|uniref:Bifunctional adenosylcobalamin biosynthesis protein n=1 Tax=Pararhizobium mangrovi TaxID=2590452 RepID=A0A506TYG5_9HYPH|nr:bifunctional adenosylcobinamide kinase/adenosylcobinamide-phosphate guanylyltransferase [Pararhizobium mangrovi]TPW27133.1 bifunctional adenosylcobinamide kinase/adenosylcobinamide-phosphate guanylyltransferase [Pararhizobium mangrovi]